MVQGGRSSRVASGHTRHGHHFSAQDLVEADLSEQSSRNICEWKRGNRTEGRHLQLTVIVVEESAPQVSIQCWSGLPWPQIFLCGASNEVKSIVSWNRPPTCAREIDPHDHNAQPPHLDSGGAGAEPGSPGVHIRHGFQHLCRFLSNALVNLVLCTLVNFSECRSPWRAGMHVGLMFNR